MTDDTVIDSASSIASQLPLDADTPVESYGGMSSRVVMRYVLGGNSIFTLLSKTGKRYTYRVRKAQPHPRYPKSERMLHVGLLTGPDNLNDYNYIGYVELDDVGHYYTVVLGRNVVLSPAYEGLKYFLKHLRAAITYNTATPVKGITFIPSGRCGRCARVLTTPESCQTGFGPECAGKV